MGQPSQPAARSPMRPPGARSMPSSACAARYASWIGQGSDHVRCRRAARRGLPRVPLPACRAALRDRGVAHGPGGAAPAGLPVPQRASDDSLRARLRAALDESQRQREEIAHLREELALAHGHVRELELDRRVGRR